jgi:glycerol-3-phosphate acyltransferase PlsY
MGPLLLDPSLMVLLALSFGYALGSVPFGLLLTRGAGLGDIRAIGSGNIGATNVLRTGNKGLAAATLLFDTLKGTAAVLLTWLLVNWLAGGQSGVTPSSSIAQNDAATQFNWAQFYVQCAGLGAFLGHLFPVWLSFKGGKGVATYIGVLLGLAWKLALVFCAVWLVVAVVTRYSSLAALVAATLAPLGALVFSGWQLAVVMALMSGLLIYRHEANIRRLVAGEESKIGGKAKG